MILLKEYMIKSGKQESWNFCMWLGLNLRNLRNLRMK